MIPTWLLSVAAIVAAIALTIGIVMVIMLWRVFFPKDASAISRAAAAAFVLLCWSSTFHSTYSFIYDLVRQLVNLGGNPNAFSNIQYRSAVTENLLRDLGAIPYFDLALALIALLLAVRFFAGLSFTAAPQWIVLLRTVRAATWTNTLILAIFFLGIYLSTASLCTIPSLQVNQPFSDSERTQVNAHIDAYTPSDDAFNKQFPENLDLPPDGVAGLRALVKQASGEEIRRRVCAPVPQNNPQAALTSISGTSAVTPAVSVNSRPSPATVPASDAKVELLKRNNEWLLWLKGVIESYDSYSCDQLTAYQGMRTVVQQTEHSEADKIKNQISANLGIRLTGRDRATYTYSLESGYQDVVSDLQGDLSRCKSQIQVNNNGDQLYLAYVTNALATAAEEDQVLAKPNGGASFVPPFLPRSSSNVESSCDTSDLSVKERFAAPVPELGVFSRLFGWLENSDSLALSVICGMLGVGLIGCVLSSFVRQQRTRSNNDPWIADAFPVIIRGFTAAIIVYLAVEGGLNVFSTQGNEANPYVLLCSCLVGSVFSEDVWDAAHDWFKKKNSLPNQDEKKNEDVASSERLKQKNDKSSATGSDPTLPPS